MTAAGTDPAFVPGLTLPGPAAAAPSPAPEAEGTAPPPAEPAAEPAAPDDAPEETAPADTAPVPDGPVFEASDQRGAITADGAGIRLRLDEEEADFLWTEIGAVETGTPRFTRRFTVTLWLTSKRRYDHDVEAPDKATLRRWTAELDAVLDAFFDDAPEAASDAPE